MFDMDERSRVPVDVPALGMTALLMSDFPVTGASLMADIPTSLPQQSQQLLEASEPPARTPSLGGRLFENVTLADVVVGDEKYDHQGMSLSRKTAEAINGIKVSSIRHGELCAICKVLAVTGYKNKKKATMAHLIAMKKINEEVYDELFSPRAKTPRAPSKQAQCPFRLLNILFSDTFAERFSRLSDTSTRQDLDARVSKQTSFWRDVRVAFLDTTDEHIGKLQFSYFALDEMEIDPSDAVPHGWKKLRSIYADTAKRWKVALSRFTTSWYHQPEFYHFCSGQLDVLYLHLHLARRPSLNGHVQADLPDGAFFDSEVKAPAPTPEKTERKTKPSGPSVAEAIAEYVHSTTRSDNAVQKLLLMQKRDEREEAKAIREENKAEKELSLLSFQEWTKISDRIRALRRELQHEDDPDIIGDLKDDIEQLKRKKEAVNLL